MVRKLLILHTSKLDVFCEYRTKFVRSGLNLGTPVAERSRVSYAPGVVIAIGPQRYTVAPEHEAEVRRLLWAQLRPRTGRREHRVRVALRVIRSGRARISAGQPA